MMNHHGDREFEQSELMKMFREQSSGYRPREYPAGRISGAMKKIAVLLLLTCAGCGVADSNGNYQWGDSANFKLNGHEYIQLGVGQSRCIVHDPDCPCNGKLK